MRMDIEIIKQKQSCVISLAQYIILSKAMNVLLSPDFGLKPYGIIR